MSDQDFFFEEDEQPVETAKPVKAQKAVKETTVSTADSSTAIAGMAQSVSMAVAVLIGVIALLAGVIIGILLPIGNGSVPNPTSTVNTGTQTAPQLTPEQLQEGELPPGHPNIGGSPGATGSAETTGN